MTALAVANRLGLDPYEVEAKASLTVDEFAEWFGISFSEAAAAKADLTPPGPDKGAVKPGDVFPAETTITASDQTNADKLAGLGYVKSGLWTTGDKMTVGTFDFYWDGTKWAAGTYP